MPFGALTMLSPRKTLLGQYRYDPLDRLVINGLPDIPQRQRFYCKNRLTTEIQGANRNSIFQQNERLLAQRDMDGDAVDTTLLATDLQRSVLQTLKADRPQQPIPYSPYGHRLAENGLLSLLGFNGERPDPLTGHYLLGNGYRAFNPVLMRFNSPDSLSPFGKGGVNSYAYCLGDPINRRDPNGRSPITALKLFLAGRRATTIKFATQHNTIDSSLTDQGSFFKLKKGVSPIEAVDAFEKYTVLNKEASTFPIRNDKYLADVNNLNKENLSPQDMARRNLLEHIKDEPKPENGFLDYSEGKLMDAATGRYKTLSKDIPIPSRKEIRNYIMEYGKVKNPDADRLRKEATAIRNKYFETI
jgi:RHS repeat-associated protein